MTGTRSFRLALLLLFSSTVATGAHALTRERYAWGEGVWKRLPPAGREGVRP